MIKQFKVLAMASAISLALPLSALAGNILLKAPSVFPSKLPVAGENFKYIESQINLLGAGNLKMKIYEPGKLVAPFEILDVVSDGKVNAGLSVSAYWAGKIPAAPFFSAVPFGPETGEFLAWLYHGNGLKLYQEMYDQAGYNVKVLVAGITAPESSGWFKEPINSVEDLKGLKIRFMGLGSSVMQKLGASTTILPAGEIFPALEKGAIDATEFSMPALDNLFGFHKVAKHNYFPGWHQQATLTELLINKDVWNSMSDHQKALIEIVCKAAVTNSYASAEASQFGVMKKNVEENGVEMHYWSDEMLNHFRTAWEEVATEESEKDAFFKKVYTDLNEFRANYKVWQDYGFLPRK